MKLAAANAMRRVSTASIIGDAVQSCSGDARMVVTRFNVESPSYVEVRTTNGA